MSRTFLVDRRPLRDRGIALLLVLALSFSWVASRQPIAASGADDPSLGALISAIGHDVAVGVNAVSSAVTSVPGVARNAVSAVERSQARRAGRALTFVGAASLGLLGSARRASAASSSGSDPGITTAAVSTLAGNGTNATTDGTGSGASFQPMGGVVVVGGYAYVGTNGSIRKVDVSSGATTTLAGDASATGCTDSATSTSVRFKQIVDLATDGTYLYATHPDCGSGTTYLIRKVTISTGATTTLTTTWGSPGYLTYSAGYLFAAGTSILKIDVSTTPDTSSSFASLGATANAIVGDGTNLWVSTGDSTGSAIKQVVISSAAVSTLVSASDGTFATTALEAAGSTLYLASNSFLRRVAESGGAWSNIAGTGDIGPPSGTGSFEDGTGLDAWFSGRVTGIASDGSQLYIADSDNYRLRVASAGTPWSAGQPAEYSTTVAYPASANLHTFAGSGTATNADGTGAAAGLNTPSGVAVVSGYAYVGTNDAIRKVNLATGAVTTLAGNLTTSGCDDSADPSQVRFENGIGDIVTDGHFLYEATANCTGAGVIRRTSIATGATSTVGGVFGPRTTIGPDGALYFTDRWGDIWRLDPTTGVMANSPIAMLGDFVTGLTADANYLWATASNNCCSTHSALYRITTGGTVTTVAWHGSDAQLALSQTASAGDYLYGFSGASLQQLSKTDGTLRTIVGNTAGFADGVGIGAQLQSSGAGPQGLVSDGSALWMSDTGNERFRKVGALSGVPDPSGCNCPKRQTRWPVDIGSGGYYRSFTDIAIPGRSPALNETRTYVAQNASYNGPFGYGWLSSYDMHLEFGILTGPSPVEVVQENGGRISYTWNGTSYVGPTSDFATLVHNGGGTWTFTRRSQEQFVFDSTGLLIQEIARVGFAGSPGVGVPAAYTTTLAYSSGRLSTVTDAAGRTLTFSYGANGKVSGMADSTGRSVAYGYDGSGNLTDVTDVASGNTHFTYYTDHTMHTVRDPRGTTDETMTYDTAGRVLTQTDGLSRTTTFDYTSIPGSTKMTDPKGNVTVDAFTNGMAMSETKGYGTASAQTWSYTYDPTTLGVATVTDPNSHVTTYTWDASGNPLTVSDALSHTTTHTYNGFGEALTIQDALGVTTTNTYDSAGNLTSTARPLVGSGTTQTTTYTHGDSAHPGDVTSVTDPRSKVWTFTHDSSTGDVLSQTTPTNDQTTYTYDAAGRRLTMVAPEGNKVGGTPSAHTTTYVPDAFGDVTSVTDPLSHQTQYVYDADRNLHQLIDPLTQTTTYTYDAANQLTTITRPDTTTLQNAYWPDGSLETQTDGAGKVTSYAYDPLGRLSTTTDPNSRVTTYTYDPAGNPATVLDAESRTASYGYDNADRLTSVSYSDGTTPNVAYTYDADNQRATMVDGTGTTTYTVDSLHRLTAQTDGASQTMTYGYDLANNLTSITYPGSHTVTRAYDDSSRLHTITDWLSHTTTYDYDHDANLTTQTYPNTTVATYTPDAADRLMNISDAKSGTPFASFAYTRNNNDTLASVTPTGVGSNETYGYSTLDQLNSVNSSSYTFDSADNVTGMPDGTKLVYDSANQLCWTATSSAACGSPPGTNTAYSYGADGERTAMTPSASNPTVNYAYDEQNRLTDVRGAEYRTAVLAANPIAYWRLGDTSAAANATTADSSGNAHPGTYKGTVTAGVTSALTTDTTNKAVTFNGTTGYVDAGNLGMGALSTFTVEAWIKTSSTANAWIASEGWTSSNTPVAGFQTATSGSKIEFAVRDNSNTLVAVTGATTVNNNAWHHLVGVRNGSTLSLYIDGKADGTATGTGHPSTITLNTTSIGAIHDSTVNAFFNGSVDEAAYYPTALSAATVVNHYQAAKSNYAGTTTANAPTADWRLGETTVTAGSTAADISTNAHPGTYKGTVTSLSTGALTGDSDKAVTLNGTTGYVDAGNLGMGALSTFTVEAWIKTSSTANAWIAAEGSTSSNTPVAGFVTATSGSKIEFAVRDNSNTLVAVTGATTINNNAWHHLVGVRNGSTLSLYIDGKADGTATGSGHPSTITLNTTSIGAVHQSTVSAFFNGSVDEAAYYPTALSATTIGWHYYNGKNSQPETASYRYNGDGTRTTKTVNGQTTPFTWDTAEGLPLLASDGTSQYVYGLGGKPLEQITGSTPVYYQQDQQGSTRALTDQSGNVLTTYTTDAYGNPAATSGTTQTPLRYDGEYRDNETGFVELRARYYDPTTAQFITRDPADSVTRSAYGYVDGNSLNASDPSGLGWGWNPIDDIKQIGSDLGQVPGDVQSGWQEMGSDFSTGWNSMPTWGKVADVAPVIIAGAALCLLGCGAAAAWAANTALGSLVLNQVLTNGSSCPANADAVDSTGSSVAQNLGQQLAMEQAMSDPLAGEIVPIAMSDPRWPASGGWVKMQQIVNGINVHYVFNTITKATADFKYK